METESKETSRRGLPAMPEEIFLAKTEKRVDWKRLLFILLGLFLFCLIYCSPNWADAIDPAGKAFPLKPEGKAALALFLLAAAWWIFEVVPIGVTAIAIGAGQALFLIRPAKTAFNDFMDPSVWFIIGSLVIGKVFTKTGLTQRMAYKMLVLVGERTTMIYLGCYLMIAALTMIMAHTAVAATVFPLLMAIYGLYGEGDRPTRFGKGLFIGMAFSAGAGSVVTLLGGARAAVAIGFFKDMAGREIGFFELSRYMFPIGWGMVILIWLLLSAWFPPEKKTIPGLRARAQALYARLGPIYRTELLTLVIVFAAILALSLHSFFKFLEPFDKSAIILAATVLFFVFNVLTLEDLEEIPWNIVLLFGGAMSIGLCLWQTGAANWMAVKWLTLFQHAHWLVFVLSIGFFCLIMTNFIMNVAAIAITMPVALAIAPYLGVAPEVILYTSLAAAGMPFLLLIGAAPNAIAYGSGQFNSRQFFQAGIPASIILMIVLAIFARLIWPLMGMPVLLPK